MRWWAFLQVDTPSQAPIPPNYVTWIASAGGGTLFARSLPRQAWASLASRIPHSSPVLLSCPDPALHPQHLHAAAQMYTDALAGSALG
jgi:hypothetical protein